MKKLFNSFVFALLLGLVFTSCSDNESSAPATIDGRWNISKLSYTINGVTSAEEDYADNAPGCSKNYLEFKTNGIFNGAIYSGSTCVLNLTVGAWSQKGLLLTITEGTGPQLYEIISLTSSTLKLKLSSGGNTFYMTFTKA